MKKSALFCFFALLFATSLLKIDFAEKAVAETGENRKTEVVKLKNIEAQKALLLVRPQFDDVSTKLVAENFTNSLIVSAPEPEFRKAETILEHLDREAAKSIEQEKLIFEKLEEPFFCETKEPLTLYTALKLIREKTGIDIFVDWTALAEINVIAETPVKFRLPIAMPLKSALDYLLKQHGLVYIVKDEILNITTKNKRAPFHTETYYVGDLLNLSVDPDTQTTERIKALSREISSTDKIPEDLFESLIEYVKTSVAPESWGQADIMDYFPNLSLVIRQKPEVHAEIVQLLNDLRKYNDLQIAFEAEIHLLDKQTGKTTKPFGASADQPSRIGLTLFSGKGNGTCRPQADVDFFVKLAPRSDKPVRGDLEAENEPFLFFVRKGQEWSVEAIASKRDGNDIVKATLKIEGKEPETRVFYASPIQPKEEEECLAGASPVLASSASRREVAVQQNPIIPVAFDVSDLIGKDLAKMEELIDLVQAVVKPESWEEGQNKITSKEFSLLVKSDTETVREIAELFKALRDLNSMQILCDVSILCANPATPEEDGQWKKRHVAFFNGQTSNIELDAKSAHVVRVRPAEWTLLESDPVERRKEILVPIPKDTTSMSLVGVVSQDRQNIRLSVSVGNEEIASESFKAQPSSVSVR